MLEQAHPLRVPIAADVKSLLQWGFLVPAEEGINVRARKRMKSGEEDSEEEK
jgi:hypothetical protein